MSKEITVEELRERPDSLIEALENGQSVTITRDGKSIATADPTVIQQGVRFPFRDLHITPLAKPLGVDPLEELLKDRSRDRSR